MDERQKDSNLETSPTSSRLLLFLGLACVYLILVIGIAVGLAIALTRGTSSNPPVAPPASPPASPNVFVDLTPFVLELFLTTDTDVDDLAVISSTTTWMN